MADIKTLVEEAKAAARKHAPNARAIIEAIDALAEAHQAEVARLTRENEGLAKDAARLDFILKTNRGHFMNRTQDFQWFIDMPPEEARANIDAALAGASGAQEGERT